MILDETYTLSNGVAIPKIGLGTWTIDDDKAAQAVRDAVDVGYRHIDTAQGYGNERGVGEGIRSSGIDRDALFVTTKLDAVHKDYDGAKAAIDESLQTAGLDHFDLMIIHSPQPWDNFRSGDHYFEGNLEAWRALEEALQAGKLRAIGVSNFEIVDIDNIVKHGSVAPAVNQVLTHISNTPFDLIDYCQSKGILIEAYSPIAHGKILDNAEIKALADKYGVSVPQLCIRYCLQLGTLPLPRTATAAHMRNNADVDFAISDADMATLRGVEPIRDYGDATQFPVFGKKPDGSTRR